MKRQLLRPEILASHLALIPPTPPARVTCVTPGPTGLRVEALTDERPGTGEGKSEVPWPPDECPSSVL